MKTLLAGAAALALFAVPALADGVDGTWKASVDSAKMPKKPEVFVITKDSYACKTCTPPISVPADGKDHPTPGNPYADTAAVTLTPNGFTEVDKKAGKVVTTSTITVAADGKSESATFTDSSASNAKPVTGKVMYERVTAGAPGEHPASGSWRVSGYSGISDNGLTVTYKVTGDSIAMSTPTGQSYTAKLGGPAVPYKGDPGTETVQVKMSGKSLVEIDMRGGKVIAIVTTTPSADGKAVTVTVENKLKGNTMTFSASKM